MHKDKVVWHCKKQLGGKSSLAFSRLPCTGSTYLGTQLGRYLVYRYIGI